MNSRSFSSYIAVNTLIVIAFLVSSVTAQNRWQIVPTPQDIVDENKKTGDEAVFEKHPDGSIRFRRITFFDGTRTPSSQRSVTTRKGFSTIITSRFNERGNTVSYAEEEILGPISYADSRNDINWQGKQVRGSRWYFRQAADGRITGTKIEELFSPVKRAWEKLETPVFPVNVFHHPSRLSDAKKAEGLLAAVGYKVTLHEFAMSQFNSDGQRKIAGRIYYYPASAEREARDISATVEGIARLRVDGAEVTNAKGPGGSATFYLLDENLGAEQPKPRRVNPAGGPASPDDPNEDMANETPLGSQNNDGRNRIVESLERNYASTKKLVDRPEYDNNEAVRLLKEMEYLAAFAEQQMSQEKAGSPRWQKFKEIKERAEADIRLLKERLGKSKPARSSFDGKWRLLVNDQPQLGEYTFQEFETGVINLNKDSKLWMQIVPTVPEKRIASLVKNSDAPFTSEDNVELRGDASSGLLEFWTMKYDGSMTDFQKSTYTLVRDDKLR